MKSNAIAPVFPAVVALAAGVLIVRWVTGLHQPAAVVERLPGADLAGRGTLPPPGPPRLSGMLVRSGALPPPVPGSWPCFRGPDRDNINREAAPLAARWDTKLPRLLWSTDLGEGYAGAAVLNGRVYVLDYDQLQQRDTLRCLSLATGREIWNRSYPVKVKRNHGMSRTVPAVTEKFVVTLGPRCQVVCADAVTGDFRWGIDLVQEYHTAVPPWYAGQCPLIDGDQVILAPGGLSLMIAVDCRTGQVLWKTPNPHLWNMTHSSVVPMTFKGQKMYVYCATGGVVGVSASDGQILWETDEWKVNIATVPTPVVVGDGRLFLTGGYNAGSMILQLREGGGKIVADPELRLKPEVFASDQQTPILYHDHLYSVIPGGQLACADLSVRQIWNSGEARFGLGPYVMAANGLLYVMNDTGVLTLVRADPAGYIQLGQVKILNGHDSWGPMSLAGGRLLARDLTRMVCVDVSP